MAYGFKTGRSSGTPGRLVSHNVENDYTVPLFAGDPVRLENGFIVRAGTTERVDGIFVGARWVDTFGDVRDERQLPANTTSVPTSDGQFVQPDAKVLQDVAGTFVAKADGPIADANIGDFFAFAEGTGGLTISGTSGFVIDASSAADVTAAADVQVLRFVPKAGNDASSATPEVEVRFLRTQNNIG